MPVFCVADVLVPLALTGFSAALARTAFPGDRVTGNLSDYLGATAPLVFLRFLQHAQVSRGASVVLVWECHLSIVMRAA